MPEAEPSPDLTTPTDKKLEEIIYSHLPFPIIAALVTLLGTATTFYNLPEAVPFVAAGGAAGTLIFTAESAIWAINKRTTRNTKA
jgi:hypothetical protein